MTLIAVFRPDAPVIVSDVLLSHEGPPRVPFLPTGRMVNPLSSTGPGSYQPHSFAQKTLLFRDDTVAFVGYGDVTKLKLISTGLRDEIRRGMTIEKLPVWAAAKKAVCGRDTGAIVCWSEEGLVTTCVAGGGIRSVPLPQGGQVLFGGSGGEWLQRNLIRSSSILDQSGGFSDYEMVLNAVVAQTAQHIAQERFLGVRHGFGGGFQVTWFNGERFVSTPQIVYLIFRVEHDEYGSTMSLAGAPVVQRSDGRNLSTQLWIPETEAFTVADGIASLRTRTRFVETKVPPLIRTPGQEMQFVDLSIGEYVGIYTVHVRDGNLIGLGSFQLTGDPKLTQVELAISPNNEMVLCIPETTFNIWRTNYEPFSMLVPKTPSTL